MTENDHGEEVPTVRKSNRDRKPNSFYAQEITDNKKIPIKQKKRSKHIDSAIDSFSDEANDREDDQIVHQDSSRQEEWYDCKMPDQSNIKVAFIVQGVEKEKKKEEIKPKAKGGADLLLMFQKAIRGVTDKEIDTNNKGCNDVQLKKGQSFTSKPFPKRIKDDKDGKIESAKIQEGNLIINHTKIGTINFPLNFEQKDQNTSSQDQQLINSLKQKIKSIKVLPTIMK